MTLIIEITNVNNSFVVTDINKQFSFKVGADYDGNNKNVITFYDHMNTGISQNSEITLQFKY